MELIVGQIPKNLTSPTFPSNPAGFPSCTYPN